MKFSLRGSVAVAKSGPTGAPGEFIEIADETGLIIPINRQLLLESCQRLKQWQCEYNKKPPLFLSVNIHRGNSLMPISLTALQLFLGRAD